MKRYLNIDLQKILWGIFVLSALVRASAAIYLGNQVVELPGTADQLSYHTLALQVLGNKGFTFPVGWWPLTQPGAPTAHWSYLYTFYLITVYAIFGPNPVIARLIQAVLVGVLQPWLVFLLGKRAFNPTVGLGAAAITAYYPYFIYYSATLMTEPFYITSILAGLYIAIVTIDGLAAGHPQPQRIILDGAALGLVLATGVLLRQIYLLILPVLFLWMFLKARWRVLPPLLISIVIITAAILPFTVFNYLRFDRFVLLNTNAGYAFFWGNHPVYGSHFISILPAAQYLEMIPSELRNLDEAELDQALLKLAIGYILEDPVRYIQLSISRIPAYFFFWPTKESGLISNFTRVFSFGAFMPFMLGGLLLIFKRHKWKEIVDSPISLLLVFITVYTLIHLLTWALIRYRLPVDAVLVLFASYWLTGIISKVFHTWRGGSFTPVGFT
jgi:hypothetical protein